jgi:hypothetical protein
MGMADFYREVKAYWSTRTLMKGYGEAAHEATQLVDEATRLSNPVTQACAGSGMAVAKMLGAIPVGINHWMIETARSTIHQGAGAGFKTLIATPIEGFIDGGKFVIHQAKKWSRGEMAEGRLGMADEVATTLGTAGLMFLGIQSISNGGTGLMQSLKNSTGPMPALALATGQVMPTALAQEGVAGAGPLATGLVFMASKKDPPEGEPLYEDGSPPGGEKITVEGLKKALENAERLELQGRGGPNWLLREVEKDLRMMGEDLALQAVSDQGALNQLMDMHRVNTNMDMLVGVIQAARKDPNVLGVLKALKSKGVEGADQALQVLSEEYLMTELPPKIGHEPH